jgi:hypothetical protein
VSNFFLIKFFCGSKVEIMKSDGWLLKNITLTVGVFLSVIMAAHSQLFALSPLSNTIPTNTPALKDSESGTNVIIPLIESYDEPISVFIENLARVAGINYLVDPRLAKWWAFPDADGHTTHEPTITFRWTNLTAKEALLRLLGEHHLVTFRFAVPAFKLE